MLCHVATSPDGEDSHPPSFEANGGFHRPEGGAGIGFKPPAFGARRRHRKLPTLKELNDKRKIVNTNCNRVCVMECHTGFSLSKRTKKDQETLWHCSQKCEGTCLLFHSCCQACFNNEVQKM